MIVRYRYLNALFVLCSIVVAGCGTVDQIPKKSPHLGLIATPTTYYSTQKAKYLGEKYKSNLDRMVERIVRNPKTANLQFANNIASVGGIGFFTHSVTSSVDERFLEVIMGAPETFDSKMDFSTKVSRVFSLYGTELLSTLVGDPDIYQEKEVSGYGLNLSWRNVVTDAGGPRIGLERTILYFSKAKVRSFLKGDLIQNKLLGEAVIFAVAEEGPIKLVSYRPQELKPDLRSPIQEETIAMGVSSKPDAKTEPIAPLLQADSAVHGEDKSSESLSSRSSGKLSESTTVQSEWKGGSKEVTPVMEEPIEVSIVSSPASTAPDVVPVEQAKESEVPEKRSIDSATSLANLQQKNSEPQPLIAQPDLQPVQISRLPSPGDDAPNSAIPLEIQEKETSPVESKPVDAAGAVDPAIRPTSQVLHGFVIQLAFSEKAVAQRWGEILERRGHAISMTETGGGGDIRLRIGSFAVREEAERQLQGLRKDGLKGIILNFPQAYRPEIRRGGAEQKGQTSTVGQ